MSRRHACALCGKRSYADEMIYSPHSGRRFCADLAACDRRRAKRNERRMVAA